MDWLDLQTTLTLAAILTATALVVFFDFLRRQRRKQPQRAHIAKPAASRREIKIFEPEPVNYAPPRPRKLAPEPPAIQRSLEKPSEPLVPVATLSRPPVEPRIERETVTVQVASPSPSAPSAAHDGSLQTVALPEFTIDAALWERLITNQPKRNLLTSSDAEPTPAPALIEAPPVTRSAQTIEASYHMIREDVPDAASAHLPTGMIQPTLLEKWLESEQRFTGLVVSVGVTAGDSSMWHTRGLMQSLAAYIAGLLKAKDYACRTAYDEFLIVCPGEQGAQSQRRLNHISERLWDYQLRGIGACSILFSWGGVQVEDQPLAEAVASANERMRETKRTNPVKSGAAHRQAV
jgi:hypothetical protein